MLLGKNHRHTGMDLGDELVRFARDNSASAQPPPDSGSFQFSQSPAKVNGRPEGRGFAVLCYPA